MQTAHAAEQRAGGARGGRPPLRARPPVPTNRQAPRNEYTVDELMRVTDTTVRSERVYQDRGETHARVRAPPRRCRMATCTRQYSAIFTRPRHIQICIASFDARDVHATIPERRRTLFPAASNPWPCASGWTIREHSRRTRQSIAMEIAGWHVTLVSPCTSPPRC
jgi:hypothetical protein